MKENLNTRLANVQVQRDEIRKPNQNVEVVYFLGWGDDELLQGDGMTYEELAALHTVIGRVIEQDKPNN